MVYQTSNSVILLFKTGRVSDSTLVLVTESIHIKIVVTQPHVSPLFPLISAQSPASSGTRHNTRECSHPTLMKAYKLRVPCVRRIPTYMCPPRAWYETPNF